MSDAPPSSPFQRLPARTFRSGALESIRAAILSGALPAGSPLVERRIAEEMGISRAPVREALSKLEEEGLVVTIPYKGTFVTEVTPRTMGEILSLRPVLEQFAAERALPRLRPENLATFQATLDRMNAAADAEQIGPFHELHLEFHRQLYVLADHQLLLQFWSLMESQLRLYLRVHQRTFESLRAYAATHAEILQALRTGEVGQVRARLVEHIGENADQLLHGRIPTSAERD